MGSEMLKENLEELGLDADAVDTLATALFGDEEDEVLEGAEYIGMIAAVYNKEALASSTFASIKSRYECVQNNVQLMKDAAASTDVVALAQLEGMSQEDYEILDGATPKVRGERARD